MSSGGKEMMVATALALLDCGGVPAGIGQVVDGEGQKPCVASSDTACGVDLQIYGDAVADVRMQLDRVIGFYEAHCDRAADRAANRVNMEIVGQSDFVSGASARLLHSTSSSVRDECLRVNGVDIMRDLRSRFPQGNSVHRGK